MKTKVWAHRGASAYAPENTLEAFLLAAEQGADGVELDVQLTKDGEMVVVHDEEIDRVSDGSGFVKDYTLAELKILNFNKTHPEYQDVKIPTLREVYEALKPTGMTINVELKTGIFWYKDLEKKVLELTKEMEMEDRVIYSSFNHAATLLQLSFESGRTQEDILSQLNSAGQLLGFKPYLESRFIEGAFQERAIGTQWLYLCGIGGAAETGYLGELRERGGSFASICLPLARAESAQSGARESLWRDP